MAMDRPKDDPTRSARRLDELLDAATIVLNGRGISSSMLNDLAQTLGLTREALYYYVDDREDLVFQAYMRSCESIASSLDEAERSEADGFDKIRAFVSHALATDAPELSCLNEIGVLRDDQRSALLAVCDRSAARLARILSDGANNGQFRTLDTDIAARSIICLVQWQAFIGRRNVLHGETAIGRADYARVLLDILDRGWALPRHRLDDIQLVDLAPLVRTQATAFDREALNAAKKEMILVTASRLINRRGIDSVSMDRIAEELNASKRSIYGLVGDKAALVCACRERTTQIFLHILHQATAMDGEPPERFVRLNRSAVACQLHPDIAPMVATGFYEGMSEDELRLVATNMQTLHRIFRENMQALFESGSARLLDFTTLSQLLGGGQTWMTKGLTNFDVSDAPRIATETTDLLRLGLAPL